MKRAENHWLKARSVVFVDKKLYSSLSLCTQMFEWVPAKTNKG